MTSDTASWAEWLTLFANRNDVAEIYSDLLGMHPASWDGWEPLNGAIVARWSPAGLRYIKNLAWKMAA